MQLEEAVAKEIAGVIREQLTEARLIHDKAVDQVGKALEEIKRLIAEIPRGEKGEKGDKGDRGEVGLSGIPGRDGLPGLPGRDGIHGKDGIDGKDGKDGAQGPAGLDGKDGAGPSRGRHRGPWKHDAEYVLDDMVTFDNSAWVAIVEKPTGKPGVGKDWQLFVRKGRDGKDGERGPPGPPGPAGKGY